MTKSDSIKKPYETPRVEVSGKVGDLTLAHGARNKLDASFPTETAFADLTFS